MSARDMRIMYTAQAIRQNIRDTIREHGGDPHVLDDYQRVGWDSPEAAVEAHRDDAFQIWLEYAPIQIRDTRKLWARFEREWPRIAGEALP